MWKGVSNWLPVMLTFDQMTFDQMTFDQMTFDQMTFDQMALDQMAFDRMAFDQMAFDQMTFNQMTQPLNFLTVLFTLKSRECFGIWKKWARSIDSNLAVRLIESKTFLNN